MEQIGITKDGKAVIKGCAKLYFESGLPLIFIFDKLQENNCIPSWLHLYAELRGNGMSHDRVMHLLNEQVFEAYGKEFRDRVVATLDRIHK